MAIWNYGSGLLFTTVTLLGLAVTRQVVTGLGDERSGAAKIVLDWYAYLNLFEIGLNATLAPLLAKALARDDRGVLAGTLSTGFRTYLGVIAITLAAASVLLGVVTWLIPVSPSNRADLRLAWVIGGISIIPMAFAPFRSLAEARQRGFKVNLALTGQALLVFALSLGFVRFNGGISGQVAALTLGALPLTLIMARDGLKAFPGLFREAWAMRPDPALWRELIALGTPTILICLCGRMNFYSDRIVVGKVLNPGLAINLDNTLKLALLAQAQLGSIGVACWAGLAELHNQGKRDDFNRRLVEVSGLVSLLGVAALGPIMAYNKHFMALWLPGQDLGDTIVAVAAVNGILLGLTSLWGYCFSGTGRVREVLPMGILGALANVGGSVGLTYWLGPIGTQLGTTVSAVGITSWFLVLALRRRFETPVVPLVVSSLRPIALGIPYTIGLYALSAAFPPRGWIALGLMMGFEALGFLAIGYWLVLSARDRAAWSHRLRSAIGR